MAPSKLEGDGKKVTPPQLPFIAPLGDNRQLTFDAVLPVHETVLTVQLFSPHLKSPSPGFAPHTTPGALFVGESNLRVS